MHWLHRCVRERESPPDRTDSTRYTGNLNYIPLSSQVGYWIVQNGGISVNGQLVTGSSNLNVVRQTRTSCRSDDAGL